MNLQDIPGYREAVQEEQELRTRVLLGIGEELCGIEVRPFALRDFLHLQAINSPLVRGGFISRMDCLRFFVLQAASYRLPGEGWLERWRLKRRNNKVIRALRRFTTEDMIEAIQDFLDKAFMDAPASSLKSSASASSPIASGGAAIVDAIARAYPFGLQEILSLELAFIFQLMRLRFVAEGGSRAAIINRRSSRVVGEYLRRKNMAAKR